jgi:hypothetical protein
VPGYPIKSYEKQNGPRPLIPKSAGHVLAVGYQLSAVSQKYLLWPIADSRELRAQKRAGDRIRTDDNNVGNVVLYQLSYTRTHYQNAAEPAPSAQPEL